MKKTALFIISFAIVLLAAVFLSPWLHQILPYKFERIFNRIVMIGTIGCVIAFVRIGRESLKNYGLIWKPESLRLLATGFVATVLVLSGYVAIQIFFKEAVFAPQNVGLLKWVIRIIAVTAIGLLVGLIEEFFFRGAVLSGLRRLWDSSRIGLVAAIVGTNAFYSIVHFVHAKKPFVDTTPTWIDGVHLLAAPFVSLVHFGDYWTGFAGLFIFGLMLTGLYLRTGSLYSSIGLHAGAVFFIKTDGLLVDFGAENMIWGSSKMYDGFIGWIALGFLYFVLMCLLKKNTSANAQVKA